MGSKPKQLELPLTEAETAPPIHTIQVKEDHVYYDFSGGIKARYFLLTDPSGKVLLKDVLIRNGSKDVTDLTDSFRVPVHMSPSEYICFLGSLSFASAKKIEFYAKRGFLDRGGEPVFVTPKGALTASGFDKNIRYGEPPKKNQIVESNNAKEGLSSKLSKAANKPTLNVKEALITTLKDTSYINDRSKYLIYSQVMLPFINALFPVNFSTHTYGASGTGKSTLDEQINLFMGGKIGGNGSESLNVIHCWGQITAARAQEIASAGSGLSVVLDDYRTTLKVDADPIFRAYANARNRETQSQASTQYQSVNAYLRSNGEDLIRGSIESLQQRVFAVPLEPLEDDLDIDDKYQRLQSTKYSKAAVHATVFVVQDILTNWSTYKREWKKQVSALEKEVGSVLPAGVHKRLPKNTARLIFACLAFADFCFKAEAITQEELVVFRQEAKDYFLKHASKQREYWGESQLSVQFLSALKSAVKGGLMHFTHPKDFAAPIKGDDFGWVNGMPKGKWAGTYCDEKNELVLPACIVRDGTFSLSASPLSPKALRQALRDDGYLATSAGAKKRLTQKRSFGYLDKTNFAGASDGKRIEVIVLKGVVWKLL